MESQGHEALVMKGCSWSHRILEDLPPNVIAFYLILMRPSSRIFGLTNLGDASGGLGRKLPKVFTKSEAETSSSGQDETS